jgi:hypothetical protein
MAKFIGIVKNIETKYGTLTKISISEKDFRENQKNGWVNAVLKTSKEGKPYLQIDEFQPKEKSEGGHISKSTPVIDQKDTDLPF